jgi:hypothetical protein
MVKSEFDQNFHLVQSWISRLLLIEHVPEHEIVFSDSIPSSRNCSPQFGAVPTPAITPTSNYSQSVNRLWNPRIPLHLSRQGLRLGASNSSIRHPNLHQSMISSSALARVFFPGEKHPLLHLGFHCFSFFPSVQEAPLLSFPLPGSGTPSPLFRPSSQLSVFWVRPHTRGCPSRCFLGVGRCCRL